NAEGTKSNSARAGSAPALPQLDEQRFDLFPRPGRLAQESQAGLDARIALEATDIDAPGQTVPSVVPHQFGEQLFQRDPMQRIVRGVGHGGPRSVCESGAA